MRRAAALITGLALSLSAGCFTPEPMKATSFKDRFEGLDFVNTANLVQLEVRLIETRFGDSYINDELWEKSLDEQVISEFPRRELLRKNGVRVGQLVGALPPRLMELMTLERSCVNPRRLLTPAGKANTIHLGPVLPLCRYEIEQQGVATQVELASAQCSLQVVPTLTDDGKVRLRFTPKVEHGNSFSHFLPTKDRSGWVMEVQRPSETYTDLSWEVTLAPNAFLVIGADLDCTDSLGDRAFASRASSPPVQRLLVLSPNRCANAGIDAEIAPGPVPGAVAPIVPPLALQAAQPTARAYSH